MTTLAGVPAVARAQSGGSIGGRVVEEGSGTPVQGATVFVTGTQRGTVTRADGSYRIAVAPGRVDPTVRFIGYVTAHAVVAVVAGQSATADVRLVKAPLSLQAVAVTGTRRAANLDLTRSVASGLTLPVNVAFGAEARLDGYSITQGQKESYSKGGVAILDGPSAGKPATPGSQLFYGFKPTDETNTTRNSVAGYVDLEGNPTSALSLDLAGRVEHFSDFGSATIGKAPGRYQLPLGLSLRAAASTGFRAPSLAQSVYSSTASNVLTVNGVPTPNEVATYPVNSAIAKALGARPLTAEKSRNLSAGAAWTPRPAFSATFDYFDITITDRIVLSENFVGATVRAFLTQNFNIIGDIRPRYFTNAINTRTTGADLVMRDVAELAPRTFVRSTIGLNRNHTDVTRVTPAPPELETLAQKTLFGRVEINRTTEVQPRTNARLNVNFQRRDFSVDVQGARYGEFTIRPDATGSPANDQTFWAKFITDVSATYRFRGTMA
ncbi:MAG: TonB-dependent receptor [Gemmatimonadaceae bacterium]|nr:TonB-dependent receptor [Gemmatimonadaceae bacterium]